MPAHVPTEGIQTATSSRISIYLYWAIPLILAAMVGAFSIDGHFVQDDKAAIVLSPLVVKEAIPFSEFFHRDFWGNPTEKGVVSWRPLLPMIWRTLWAIRPGAPLQFHLLTFLLHLVTTGVVFLLGRHLFQEREIPWAAAVLFAVHPVHAEALGEIVSQADILATVFGLLAVYIAVRYEDRTIIPFLVPVLLVMACLAKESAVIFSAAIAVAALLPPHVQLRKRLSISFWAALVTVLTILVQLSFKRTAENPADNIAFVAHGIQRTLHALYIVGRAVGMCFVPIGMSPFHDYAAIDLSVATLLPYAIPGVLFLCIGFGGLWIALKKRSIAGVVLIGLLLGPIVLNSSLFVRVGTELAERLLYPASVAASMMAAFLVYRVIGFRAGRVVIVVLILFFSIQSWSAQRPWRNQLALYAYGVQAEPLSAKLRVYYGNDLLSKGDVLPAAWHFMAATYIKMNFPNPVDPIPIIQLEQMPIEQRIMEAPALFAPDDPGRFLDNYSRFLNSRKPGLAQYMRDFFTKHYREMDNGSDQVSPAQQEN